jgi:GT2 family glycosyltransferase
MPPPEGEGTETPDVSIIIVGWNSRDLLAPCLEAVHGMNPDRPREVILIDNASADGTATFVRERHPEVMLVANADNLGFARANNQGMKLARGRFVLLLNPDTEVRPSAIPALIEYLETHPEVGACGPKLIYPDGRLQPNGRRFPSLASQLLVATGLRQLNPAAYDLRHQWQRTDFERVADVDEVSGACLMVRREVIEEVGGMDEDLFMYYEEVDWCYRIKRARWRIAYVPAAVVVHHIAQSVNKAGFRAYRAFHTSQYRYFRKHFPAPAWLLMRVVSWLQMAHRYAIYTAVRMKRRLRAGRR